MANFGKAIMLCGGQVIRIKKTRVLALISVFFLASLPAPVSASTLQLVVAEDKTTGYQRSAFKHWIDADKNGCDTRAEVLIAEAVVKPKIGPKCKLTGGRWISVYDEKTITNPSQLDVDHLVPLAEAWRSGAWKWTAAQRQAFANDLGNWEALIAVSANINRSKSDKDPALWMPSINRCVYIMHWVTTKWRYSLTVDAKELTSIENVWLECFGHKTFPFALNFPKVIEDPLNSDKPSMSPTPIPSPSQIANSPISPGAFCSPAGATGKSSSGVTYTCKASSTDSSNRWRQ